MTSFHELTNKPDPLDEEEEYQEEIEVRASPPFDPDQAVAKAEAEARRERAARARPAQGPKPKEPKVFTLNEDGQVEEISEKGYAISYGPIWADRASQMASARKEAEEAEAQRVAAYYRNPIENKI